MTRRAAVGTGILVAGAFLLLQLAWLLTMPAATGIDEFDHIHRAASVGSGHWGYSHDEVDADEGRGGLIPVPEDIVAATNPACESRHYVGPANCNAYADAGGDMVLVASAAARYNPLFYVLVGYPSSVLDGDAALTAMRVAAAALSAGMLALGAVAIRSWARTGWPLLGLFVAATPTVVYSTSIAAPNGLNIVSGLTLWAALLGFLYGADDVVTRRRLLIIAGIAAVTLVNTHTLGLVWMGLIVVAVVVQRGSWTLPPVPRPQRRQTWLTVLAVLACAALAVVWILAAQTNDPAADATTFTESWWEKALTIGVPLWPLQAIAAFPMRDEMAPLAVYAIGVSLMCSLAAVALVSLVRQRNRSALLAIAFVAVVSYAVPLVLTALSFRHIGLAWQGRYEMPFTGGLLLLYAVAIERSKLRLPAAVAASVAGLLALMNLLGQVRITRRYDGTGVARAIGWDQPSPILLGLLALGFAVLGFLALRRFRPEHEASESSTPESTRSLEPVKAPTA